MCNNRQQSDWGASNMPQKRLLEPIYEDGIGSPVGSDPSILYNGFRLPLVREVSNVVGGERNQQDGQDQLYNHIMTVWGQYIDHDMDLTPQSKDSVQEFSFEIKPQSSRCPITLSKSAPT